MKSLGALLAILLLAGCEDLACTFTVHATPIGAAGASVVYALNFTPDGQAEVIVDDENQGSFDDRDPERAVLVLSGGEHTIYARRGGCISPPFKVRG